MKMMGQIIGGQIDGATGFTTPEIVHDLRQLANACETCLGFGFVVGQSGRAIICDCRKVEIYKKTCGLVGDELMWSIEYIANMTGKEHALAWARDVLAQGENARGWTVLFGSYGVGKSGLLKSLVAALVKDGVRARYLRLEDFLAEIRSSYSDDTEEREAEILDKILDHQFVAIDEVDRISSTSWAMATAFRLLDRRYNVRDRVATAMATNLAPITRQEAEVTASTLPIMGPEWGYLVSRMRDGLRIPMTGKSLRGKV